MLLATGALILLLGINYFGGFDAFWTHLPRSYRTAFANFNEKPAFNSVGIFWQDGLANTAVFYFLNQGIIMRFLSAKSVNEARKAALFAPLVLMVLAAIATASGGWVARAMVHAGILPPDLKASDAFFVTTELISRPGVFGLVVATLIAALMSTVDTLITAIAAIIVNDVYKPHIRPAATEQQMLRVARLTSVGVTLVGVLSVPVFMQFRSVYEAHGAFTAAVTPPLVITLFFSVFWKRYTRQAALWTLAGGLAAVIASGFFPELITPFAHGVPRGGADAGFFAGMRQHTYMRAAYGLAVCAAIGVIVTLFTRPEPLAKMRGLVWGTVADALRHYKGSAGVEWAVKRGTAIPRQVAAVTDGADDGLPRVRISSTLSERLGASSGDLLYISDTRWWLGGLRSSHAVVADIAPSTDDESVVELAPAMYDKVVSTRRPSAPLVVEKLY
jgi:SSS family solute:Na+ symporter